MMERNWAGNYAFSATTVHQPETVEELRRIVAGAPRIHAIGTCHSFNDIADAPELVTLDHLEMPIEIDNKLNEVTVGAATTYGVLAQELERTGLALHNMASLPHISIGGAVATGTHGSGTRLGSLATAVKAIELVTSQGEVVLVSRGEEDFAGMVVNLGALGVVTRLALDVQPTYQMRQVVYEHLSWDTLFDHFEAIMSSADSVSVFTDFGEDICEMWQKTRLDSESIWPVPEECFGGRLAARMLHPVPSLSAANCTEQLGKPGCWLDRLPHFRIDAIPASGHEIQTEYMVAREDAVAALQAILATAPTFRQHLLTSEIRSVAADQLWMSPFYHRDSVCIHFSWKFDPGKVDSLLPLLESTLKPFNPRPHWGKVFHAPAGELANQYPRLETFRGLMERLDPRGAFRTAYLERNLLA